MWVDAVAAAAADVQLPLAAAPRSVAYSMLTHEEIIDLLWDQQIVPLLKARFPNASPDELKTAHAYAYGGSVIHTTAQGLSGPGGSTGERTVPLPVLPPEPPLPEAAR